MTSSKRIYVADYQANGMPFYRGKEIIEKHKGNTNVSTELFISMDKFLEIKRKFGAPQADDLLLTSVGTLGVPYVVRTGEKFYFKDGNLTWFRNFENLDSCFLYYWLLSPQGKAELKKCTIGSSQPAFTIVLLKDLQIELPPIPIQRKIASILSAYDDLIENNTHRSKILEEMAKTIYEEWFVKFHFPGHEKVKMVESELGLIPEGWEVRKFSDLVWINPLERVPKDTKKPYVSMAGLSSSFMIVDVTEVRTGNSGSKFRNKDTLFARITPCLENGKTGFPQFLSTNDDIAIGSTEFIVFRSKALTPEYVYLLARQEDFRGLAIKSMSGASGRQRVDTKCFEKYSLAKPGEVTLGMFTEIIEPIFREIDSLNRKNLILRQTRDLLLPKLISGEIDVENLDINTGGFDEPDI